MLKRSFKFILLITMLFSVMASGMVAMAEEYATREFIMNGDFEWDGGSYTFWNKHEYSTEITYGGSKKAAVLRTTADNAETTDALECRIIIASNISGLIGGQTYTVSYYLYRDVDFQSTEVMNNYQSLKAGTILRPAAGMKLEYKDASGAAVGSASFDSSYPDEMNTWQQFTFTTKAPANAVSAVIHMRSQGAGNMYFDNLSIIGACTAKDKEANDDLRARCQEGYEMSEYFYNKSREDANELQLGGDNLVGNPGFEKQTWSWSDLSYILDTWKTVNIEGVATRSTADKHSGSASLLINVPNNYSGPTNPYTYQRITPPKGEDTFVSGAQYYISAWVKTVDAPYGSYAYMGVKAHDANGNEISEEGPTINTGGEWKKLVYIYTMPADMVNADLYLRCTRTAGMKVYFDDVEFGLASSSDPLLLSTQHTFNYVEDGDIVANVTFNTSVSSIESGSKVKYTLLDKNDAVVATNEVATAASNEWSISPSLMTKKEKYILKAEYIHPNGNVNEDWTKTKNIYLYDRPKTLDADGHLLDGDIVNGQFVPNGKIVPTFFTYRWVGGRYDEFANAGITVIRPDEKISIELLDSLHAKGMKALIKLYGTDPAGHPKTLAGTIDTVTRIKDHPAVAAYMLMDEPTKQVNATYIRTYDEMLYYLEEAYKTIRAIDDIHPTYVIESSGDVADGYERTSQMTDIFAIDPYPSGTKAAISGSIAAKVEHARRAVYDERPVWMLGLAASGWSGDYGNPENYGSAMLRYQLYDALWAGAKGAGHYVMATNTMPDGTSYEDIYLDTFTQAKVSGELDEIYDHFLLGNSKILAEGTGNGYQWRSWYKDNGEIYLVVRSKLSDSGTVLDTVTANFKLANPDVRFTIDGFDAELVNGTSEQTVSSATNEFTCTITKGEVSLYKINPVEKINIKTINATKSDIIPLEYGAEIITNGDAESGDTPAYQTSQAYTAFSRTDEKKANGSYSFMIAPKNNGLPQYRITNVPIEGNAYYELSFNMYSDYFTEAQVPTIWLYYQSETQADIRCIKLHMGNADLFNGEWQKYTYILPQYTPTSSEPEIKYMSMQIKIPSGISSVYFDDVSIRKVTAFNEEQRLSNTSFEMLEQNSYYTNANSSSIRAWTAGNAENIYLSADAHNGINSIGINNTSISSSAFVDGGKTYQLSAWFDAKDLTSANSYPSLKITVGDYEYVTDFANAYDRKGLGWYKLSTDVTIPDSVVDMTAATVSLVMNGTDTGYFDDASFTLSGPAYTLRNLKTTTNDTSVTVEYDITNHFTEDGGTIIYVFYDVEGRLVKTQNEPVSRIGAHITKTFDKVDFASMKIFAWDNLGGLIPYSNVIE